MNEAKVKKLLDDARELNKRITERGEYSPQELSDAEDMGHRLYEEILYGRPFNTTENQE